MSDRERIFERIRSAPTGNRSHPGPHPETGQEASFGAFAAALARAGGEARGPFDAGELSAAVAACCQEWGVGGRTVAEAAAARILGEGPFEIAADSAVPASFADVAVGIAAAWLGVAENGAVAALGHDTPHRSLLFLAERLVLLLDASRIVADLHAGFRVLPAEALRAHHLTWIAGPSKSADIEQTLVQGAHGPRELAVFAYRREEQG